MCVLRSGRSRGVGEMSGSVGGIAAAPSLLLVGSVDGSLKLRVQTWIHILRDVGWNLGTGHWGCRLCCWSRNWILVVFLEPLNQFINASQHLIPVPVSVYCHSHILNPGSGSWLVCETEFPRQLFRGTEEVRNSLWIFAFLIPEQLFEAFWVSSVCLLVALVGEQIPGTGCYWLDVSCQNLIQIFIFLYKCTCERVCVCVCE